MLQTFALLLFLLQGTPKQHVILAIGDSMTAGYGVPADSSYPAQLERRLKKLGYDYRVVNQGVTGSTTTQALGRLTRALAVQPDVVIIQLGGNDVSQGIRRNQSVQNVRTIIERFKPGGARILFAGGRFPYLDALARELNVPVIPFLDGVAGHPELLISDGVHPNADGYAIVVENIMTTLEPLVRSHIVELLSRTAK